MWCIAWLAFSESEFPTSGCKCDASQARRPFRRRNLNHSSPSGAVDHASARLIPWRVPASCFLTPPGLRRMARITACLAALLLLCTTAASAQDTRGVISGTVRLAGAIQPAGGVTVELLRSGGVIAA